MYAVMPVGMDRIGNTFWPDGIPKGSSKPAHYDRYVDSHGVEFSICYTQAQIEAQVKRQCCFAPYFPLTICGDI